ncbi:PKD domain-containing protein [Aquimarina macrocephali]|uniref:PKD domain-containing protein n=1 Tax=Aquimarina macrocephali TaxID=666563 RepID=UPI003F67368D
MRTQIIYLFLFLSGIGFGQELNTYSPVSPTAASLGKFGVFPVNTNLGTTNISIPLYTIKQGDIEIPVSLSYNATSGIRVNEEASWVGLGWTLNAGGAIVRNVKGQPGAGDIPNLENVTFDATYNRFFRDVTQRLADSNHDEYIFNYSGNTGKFIYDQNAGKFVFIDYKPVTINATASEGDYTFSAITENGSVLNFDAHEITDNFQDDQSAYTYRKFTTSSYLTKITSANQTDIVTLEYDSHTFNKKREITGDQVSMPLSSGNGGPLPGWKPLPPKPSLPKPYIAHEKTLKRINFKSGYVLFDYSMDRVDSESSKLNHIKIYATINGVDQLIKQITFNYDYYNRSGGGYHLEYQSLLKPHYRNSLRLNGVDVYSNTSSPQKYHFEYNTTPLPLRTSSGQDFWGYPNNNTGSYVHKHETDFHFMIENHKSRAHKAEVGNGDRTPDETKMKAGILKKIIYPTGGYTEFAYEANKYQVLSNVPEYGNERISVSSQGMGSRDGYTCTPTGLETKTFRPQQDNIVEAQLNISFTNALDPNSSNNPTLNGSTSYVKFDGKTYQRKGGCSPQYCATSYAVDLTNLSNNFEHTLEAREDGNGALGASPCPSVYASVSWKYLKGHNQETVTHLVGGLRIKTITNYDGVNSNFTSKKEYTYNKPNVLIPVNQGDYKTLHLDTSSPRILNIITSYPTYALDVNGGPSAEYTQVTEYNYDYSGKDNGKIVYVYEPTPADRIMDNGVTGSQFNFFMHPNHLGSCIEFNIPYNQLYLGAMQIYGYGNFINYYTKSWASGSLKKQEFYKRNRDNSYTKIKSVENDYTLFDQTSLPINYIHSIDPSGLSVSGGRSGFGPCSAANFSFLYNRGFYSFGKKLLATTKETNYDTNGGNPIVTEKTYNYDHPNYFQTQNTIKNSKGNELKTKTFYPNLRNTLTNLSIDDKNAYGKLEQLHRIAVPIQTETYSDNTILSTQRNLYKPGTITNSYFPKSIQVAKGVITASNPLTDRIQYHKYDAKGNPIEVSKVDGTHIMYIWGYQDTYPIAKIENATYVDTAPYIADLKTKSNADIDHCKEVTCKEQVLRVALQNLREALPNAMVSTYTYDPLIGVTSMTDPQGETAYYQYDEMNRMQYALDNDQHIAQQVRYNYQGQQSATLGDVTIQLSASGSVQPNQSVTFTANTSGSGGANLYTWSVDGTQEQCDSTTSFTKTFASEGTYTVTVLAYNTQTKHRVSKTMNVVVAYPPINIPVLSANYSSVITGTNVNFSASGIGGGTGDLRYEWYVNTIKQASTATTFTYTNNTAGTYTVYFKVIDNRSGKSTDSEVRLLHMYNPLIAPVISASKAHIVQGTTTTFTATGIGGGTGLRLYQWYINDVKQSATGTTYSYNFPNAGTYTIKFRVVDRGLENSQYQWGGNAPIVKSYPGMVASTSQSHTSISGSNPSVTFNVTSLTGGSGNSQITWKAYNSINLSQALGSGSGTNFGFSNFATGTHEYTIQAKIKDNLTGQEITKVMVVVATVSTDTGGGGNTGEQH